MSNRLFDLASSVFDTLIAEWPHPDVDAIALPTERQYVNSGDVIWDCQQFVVSVERTFGEAGDVGAEQFNSDPGVFAIRAMTIAVWIIRCWPDIDSEGDQVVLPAPTDIQAASEIALADADSVLRILAKAQRQGNLAGCNSLAFENWTAVGPESGFGGGLTRVRAGLV